MTDTNVRVEEAVQAETSRCLAIHMQDREAHLSASTARESALMKRLDELETDKFNSTMMSHDFIKALRVLAVALERIEKTNHGRDCDAHANEYAEEAHTEAATILGVKEE